LKKEQPFALLHIPHSSTYIPVDLRETLLLSDKELSTELLRTTDHYTHELFQCDPYFAAHIVFPVSRLIVDPERFLDDSMEAMSEVGMGVIYTRTSDGRVLRDPDTPSNAAK
jgi:N-formylglutamate amidohydrolase